ncbi:MAG: AI-2E family transporter [Clostridiales bacterium]|nr:AI-2E family transporter [Clostridiales bacterium]
MKKLLEQVAPWLLVVIVGVTFYEVLEHLSWVIRLGKVVLDVLFPFLVGVALAWLLDIPTRILEERWLKNRALSVAAVLVGVVLVIWLLIAMVVPQLSLSAESFLENVPDYLANLEGLLAQLPVEITVDETIVDTLFSDWESIWNEILTLLENYSGNLFAYGRAIGNGLVTIITAVVAAIYILLEKEQMVRQLRKVCRALLPDEARNWLRRLYVLSDRMLTSFLAGKILDSTVIGLLSAVVLGLLRIPFTPLISVLIGVTNIVPVVGPIIGGIIGGVILLLASPGSVPLYAILVLIIQQLDGHVIGPKILGNTVGLSTMWTLFAIVIGGDLFGFAGMILGVPVFAVLYNLGAEFINGRLQKKDAPAQPKKIPENVKLGLAFSVGV